MSRSTAKVRLILTSTTPNHIFVWEIILAKHLKIKLKLVIKVSFWILLRQQVKKSHYQKRTSSYIFLNKSNMNKKLENKDQLILLLKGTRLMEWREGLKSGGPTCFHDIRCNSGWSNAITADTGQKCQKSIFQIKQNIIELG